MGDISDGVPRKEQLGRYGENWHQKAFLVKSDDEPGLLSAARVEQFHGTSMGLNNYVDGQAALDLSYETPQPCAVIVKHTAASYATDQNQVKALERSWQTDPEASFGSVIAFNRPLELETARVITERPDAEGKIGWFVEVIYAPDYDDGVLDYINASKGPGKKNLRVLKTGPFSELHQADQELRYIPGAVFVQDRDSTLYLLGGNDSTELLSLSTPIVMQDDNSGKDLTVGVVTERQPESSPGLVDFVIRGVKHTKSNAITIARELGPGRYQQIGQGVGQRKRNKSTRDAIESAAEVLALEYRIGAGQGSVFENAMIESQRVEINGSVNRHILSFAEPSEETYVFSVLQRSVLGSDAFYFSF